MLITLSLDLQWKGEFDDVEFIVFSGFSSTMVQPVEENIMRNTDEDETAVADDNLAWVAPEPRNKRSFL